MIRCIFLFKHFLDARAAEIKDFWKNQRLEKLLVIFSDLYLKLHNQCYHNFKGITILCKEGVIDIMTTVKVLAPKFKTDVRNGVSKKFYQLLSLGSSMFFYPKFILILSWLNLDFSRILFWFYPFKFNIKWGLLNMRIRLKKKLKKSVLCPNFFPDFCKN